MNPFQVLFNNKQLLNLEDYFNKKRSFALFKERFEDYRKLNDLDKKAKVFWLRLNYRVFMAEFPK